jgi:glutathione synthase/RimK-type ligase-like ATP-grasp enzyme
MIKLGIVMDPIASINIKKDSSFAMLLEAQRAVTKFIIWRWPIFI